MPTHLYLAPAAGGKTDYIIKQTRCAAKNLGEPIRIIVASALQAQALKQRLAQAGGTLGVSVELFHDLYRHCLDVTSVPYTELSEPVQFRLLKGVVDGTPLIHYAPIKHTPGFITLLQSVLGEFKAARITPEQLAAAVDRLDSEPRLVELARLYAAYQHQLQTYRWTDRPGLGWLALEALAHQPGLANYHLFIDGFDNFTATQLEFLRALTGQVRRLVITLTGTPNSESRPLAQRRFNQTRQRLEAALSITAQPLPGPPITRLPLPAHLEAHLFEPSATPLAPGTELTLLETIDRPAEVRAALRWLKKQIVQNGVSPAHTALLARDIAPYRPTINQIGAEFGLPLRMVDGQPLNRNPVTAVLLTLLRIMLPGADNPAEPVLPYPALLEVWRSPFFDWSGLGATTPDGNRSDDARLLTALARQQQVLGGLSQWHMAFDTASGSEQALDALGLAETGPLVTLRATFDRLVQRLTPPPEANSYLAFAVWLEDLIGSDPELTGRYLQPNPYRPISLRVIDRIRAGCAASENLAALHQLKSLLRSLVWVEQEALALAQPVTYAQFVEELTGLIEASFYVLPTDLTPDAILVADVPQARGLSFAAVAVLGLAEGEFPATLSEDPLLPEADRQQLIKLGLPLSSALDSAEAEFFYETMTRAHQSLWLSRPRLADNGAEWPASPFWEEVRQIVAVRPHGLDQDNLPLSGEAASWPELLSAFSVRSSHPDVGLWLVNAAPGRQQALVTSVTTLTQRLSSSSSQQPGEQNGYNGQLLHMATHLDADFGWHYTWSASQLESYCACPFMFFTQRILDVVPREEPAVGPDTRQLGRVYHRLFEETYAAVSNPLDLDDLLAAYEVVSAEILNQAPVREGFRPTAWWLHTRQAIATNVRTSLVQFAHEAASLPPERQFLPVAHEAHFGYDSPFAIQIGAEAFYFKGKIDRIDQNAAGEFRIVDYKTGGPAGFKKGALQRDNKLQLPLYALAAREALHMGEPVDGFYWHVRHAQASDFTLRSFEDDDVGSGPVAAIELALAKAWTAVRSVRAGHFVPQPPNDGCPAYCPAATFCWQYQPKGW